MIDEEWLRELQFDTHMGGRVSGILGMGSEQIVFNHTHADGTKSALSTYNYHLAYFIREIPPFLSKGRQYSVETVNRKLRKLVGNPNLDLITKNYHRVWSHALKFIYVNNALSLNLENVDGYREVLSLSGEMTMPYMPEALHFLFATPMMHRRLVELANIPAPKRETEWERAFGGTVTVNGPNFQILADHEEFVSWANATLKMQEKLAPTADFEPSSLANNPVFIWGAAVTDGFFSNDELPAVVAFIKKEFGWLPSDHRVGTLMEQILAVANLLAGLKNSSLQRFVSLAGALGFEFDVYDEQGKIAASSPWCKPGISGPDQTSLPKCRSALIRPLM